MLKALITGGGGQDASYLAEFLLEKGYDVHVTMRRTSQRGTRNIDHILNKITIHSMSLESYASVYSVIRDVLPNEIYHLAAQSFVKNSFEDEFTTMNININGTHHMLHAFKEIVPWSKFYFAGSSEMFGNAPSPQNEETSMRPVSPYGISKLAGYNLCKYYRDAYKKFICCGILFNHESPRRGYEFVTKKITQAAKNKQVVKLGNVEARRDWGFAGDYVEAMHLMMQQPVADDYVIATGETHSVADFCKEAGVEYEVDQRFWRPNELHQLCGDATKARQYLGWEPKVTFKELVRMMCES